MPFINRPCITNPLSYKQDNNENITNNSNQF